MNNPPFEACPYAALMPDGYKKQGAPAIIEAKISSIVADPGNINCYFDELNEELDGFIPGQSAAACLRRARLMRAAGEGVVEYMVWQEALPQMTKQHQKRGTLIASDTVATPEWIAEFEDRTNDTLQFKAAVSGTVWIDNAMARFLDESKADAKHPYHRLHSYLETGWTGYVAAFTAHERKRTGTVEPKIWKDPERFNYEDLLKSGSQSNLVLALDLVAAAAVHYMHYDTSPTAAGLLPRVQSRLPQMRWIASTDRNSGIRKAEKAGLMKDATPTGAANLLIRKLVDARCIADITPDFMRMRVMADPDFCAVDAARNGPPPKPGVCIGDLNIDLANDMHRRNTAVFFKEIGLPHLHHPIRFSAATVMLGLGYRQAEATFLPLAADFLAKNQAGGA